MNQFFFIEAKIIIDTKASLKLDGSCRLDLLGFKEVFLLLAINSQDYMRSIATHFKKEQERNSNLGDFICLKHAVTDKRFSRYSLLEAFNNLIPKDDYGITDKKTLIDELDLLSNPPEEPRNEG